MTCWRCSSCGGNGCTHVYTNTLLACLTAAAHIKTASVALIWCITIVTCERSHRIPCTVAQDSLLAMAKSFKCCEEGCPRFARRGWGKGWCASHAQQHNLVETKDVHTPENQGQRVPARWQSIANQLGKLVRKSEKKLRKLRQACG